MSSFCVWVSWLDPLSPMIHSHAGLLHLHARRYDIPLKELDKSLELDPNFVPAHANRVNVYLVKSMFDEALAELERVLPFLPSTPIPRAWLGSVYAISGRTEEAKQILRECEETWVHKCDEDTNPQVLAVIYSKLGNRDRAFEWLEKAFKARTITPFEVKLNPFFDAISLDPRFDELVKKTFAARLEPRDG